MSAPTPICVCSCHRWNFTGFQLTAGPRYRIEVLPDQHWMDWQIRFGPEGGTQGRAQHIAARWLRFQCDETGKAEYFTLIGTVGKSLEHAFVIGKGPREFTAPASGELVCFANDLTLAYWNNSGSICILVSKMLI